MSGRFHHLYNLVVPGPTPKQVWSDYRHAAPCRVQGEADGACRSCPCCLPTKKVFRNLQLASRKSRKTFLLLNR